MRRPAPEIKTRAALDGAFAERLQIPHGLAGEAGSLRHAHFGGVTFQVEGGIHRYRALAFRQQPPSESEKKDAARREQHAHWREIEHGIRLADRFRAHARYQDIRRSADEGNGASDQRGE